MDMTPTRYQALRSAVDHAGTETAFADICGVSQPAVNKWLNITKQLPAEHVLHVEAATGVSRHYLRPDIYPLESHKAVPIFTGVDRRHIPVTTRKNTVSKRHNAAEIAR